MLVFISVIPFRLPGFDMVTPSLLSISVFYWSLHRPYLMPPVVVFVLGVIQDIISGAPFGLSSFIMLIIYVIAVSQRQVFVGKAFIQMWWGFMLVAIGMSILTWVVMCFYSLSFIPFIPVMVQSGLTILFFPLLSWIFALVQSGLMKHT
ncbi:MAG: rod shape-determining protein MreD [Sneathiella sp.]|nr:rod shape-determining protein MreD [Sneathiella sp.]